MYHDSEDPQECQIYLVHFAFIYKIHLNFEEFSPQEENKFSIQTNESQQRRDSKKNDCVGIFRKSR